MPFPVIPSQEDVGEHHFSILELNQINDLRFHSWPILPLINTLAHGNPGVAGRPLLLGPTAPHSWIPASKDVGELP